MYRLRIYDLESPIPSEGDIIVLPDKKGMLAEFFIWNEGDGNFLQFSKLRAQAQGGVKWSAMRTADYLRANIGIPIFSAKAREFLTHRIPNDLQFYECEISCEGREEVFFICKVMKYMKLVDGQRSSFRTLSEGEKILNNVVYRNDLDEDFYIARDVEFCERLVVSEKFVDLCQSERLHIEFGNPL